MTETKKKVTVKWVEDLVGRELTESEQLTVDWLNNCEWETIQNVMNLLDSAHRFGYISGEKSGRM